MTGNVMECYTDWLNCNYSITIGVIVVMYNERNISVK